MNDTGERASILSMCGGDALARFDAELEKAWKNILDASTDAEARRTIKLTLTLKPDENRDIVRTVVKVESKLAAPKAEPTTILLNLTSKGEIVATERASGKQEALPFDGDETRSFRKPRVVAAAGE